MNDMLGMAVLFDMMAKEHPSRRRAAPKDRPLRTRLRALIHRLKL